MYPVDFLREVSELEQIIGFKLDDKAIKDMYFEYELRQLKGESEIFFEDGSFTHPDDENEYVYF